MVSMALARIGVDVEASSGSCSWGQRPRSWMISLVGRSGQNTELVGQLEMSGVIASNATLLSAFAY
ncbi:hypothetical protein BD779DRAFT_1584915 [Infundibulicybe gibba]|nr:hypothetical protein BD779DRAFT_1584915 [Infundibulicybe gibba]